MADRKPRASETRESETRRKPWAPPSHLAAPDAPEGFVHRWIRVAMRGEEDKMNVPFLMPDRLSLLCLIFRRIFEASQRQRRQKNRDSMYNALIKPFPVTPNSLVSCCALQIANRATPSFIFSCG